MFRPPTTIESLPDELLLNICAQFTDLNRNRDLASLALISQRWRPIAQEWLLKEPQFNLTYIDQYIWGLGHHPHLQGQVRSLEIWSKSEDRIQRDEYGRSIKVYKAIKAPKRLRRREGLMERCAAVVAHFAQGKEQEDQWLDALRDDVVPALFGVLLCILPNLEELKLGSAWLMDFPLFSIIRSREAIARFTLPIDWKHDFLTGALTAVLPRLRYLEVPTDMTSIYFPSRITSLFDFRAFTGLKELGITMKALSGFGIAMRAPPDPKDIFPATLEVLRISEASDATANVLNELCLAKKASHFPSLRRVEVYHLDSTKWTKTTARLNHSPHPIEDVRVMFKDAGLELYLYFPPWGLRTWESGGTPWRLKKELDALRRAESWCYLKGMGAFGVVEVQFPYFEAEWDSDGDAVMI
ncbi:uncharacterized protein K460DRAFT_275792 [Cucurbitaria berberidis CBS 394.84]|uniref:F-box domain-containing protein n=1 Tax=Cucurbitaria berberidis CBS 394.84 TaxID=1168544 RepID=A0A9P4GNC0_9PLEO|nr:uncharacterized protein K460DRAFT_275792 [Cucurbitaria berberidis CBS 394.84]KAF1848730.1 hypothetical protein K460DRAFT_275792 [Cucurbitaria berberidis CBS 394.84]